MESVPKLVRTFVESLVPASLIDDVVLFKITNRYVKWINRPEIVVVTKYGEIIELSDRQPVLSFVYEKNVIPEDFRLHFNKNKRSPDYVIKADDNVYIIGKSHDYDDDVSDDDFKDDTENIDINQKYVGENEKMDVDDDVEYATNADLENLKLLAKFDEVTRLEIDDQECTGYSKLKLWRFDELLPTVLDSRYRAETNTVEDDEESAKDERIMSILMNNLREAKLNTARNRKILEKKQLFRRQVSHAVCEEKIDDPDTCPISKEEPWYRVNNGKLIIGTTIRNISKSGIELMDLCLIDTVTFVTPSFSLCFYNADHSSPLLWKKCEGILQADESLTFTCVIQVPEFSSSSYNYRGFLHYKYENNISFLMIDITLKASDIIEDNKSPILCDISHFNSIDVLSILVTTETKSLNVYFFDGKKVDIKTFCVEKLKYENDHQILPNVLKHSKSSLHLLHGTVIYTDGLEEFGSYEKIYISYRNTEQLLLLINSIYDLIATRIVILPSNCKQNDTFKYSPTFSKTFMTDCGSNEKYLSEDTNQFDQNESHKAASILHEQMALISQHIEKCIEAMSESNNGEGSGNTSMEINLLSLGKSAYTNLWKKIHEKCDC